MQKNLYPGKFIVIDGLDGSGLTTQSGMLLDFFNKPRYKLELGNAGAYLTKEPTDSLIGGLIRSNLRHDWKTSPDCLQLLFAADRARHLEKDIIPLLKKGIIVICDRYMFSSIAYGNLELEKDWLIAINKNFLLPDFTFFIKTPAKICIQRIQKNRYEQTLFEKEEILEKVLRNYECLAEEFENFYTINGEQSPEKIHEEIIRIITKKN